MAEPFVFHFKPRPDGFPEVMTIVDLQGICALCQHDEIQRFYRALPFHSMTFDKLLELARGVDAWAEYECANCGSEVGPDQVVASAMVWGFADDSGLIRIFRRGDDEQYQLAPGLRLDPQELPGFEPDPNQGTIVETFDADAVEDLLGRPFSIKRAIRELLVEVWREGGGWAPFGKGLWLVADRDAERLQDHVDEIGDPSFRDATEADSLVSIDLLDSAPHGLETLHDPVGMPGRLETWLGPDIVARLQSGELAARALVDTRLIRASLERAFDVARLEGDFDDERVAAITTPTEQPYPHELRYHAIARRGVYTGISPGEAARLTAEEVVSNLLNLKRRKSR